MDKLFKDLVDLQKTIKNELPLTGRVDGIRAQLIWQFLRFNKQYRVGYDALIANPNDEDLVYYF